MAANGRNKADPGSKLVLIVDDDENIRSLMEVIVASAKFRFISAGSGEEAIKLLADKPDALLLDLIMPGCGGLGVLKHFKGSAGPVPPIIVITAYEPRHPAVMEAVMDPNVVQCLSKPISHEVLIEALHRYMKTAPPPQSDQGTQAVPPDRGLDELTEHYFFKGFSEESKRDLLAAVETENYPDGIWLFDEGDAADWVYLVLSGEIELIRSAGRELNVSLEIVPQGGYFGEVAILENRGRAAGARAKGPATVAKIPCGEVRKALEREPATVTMHLLRRVLIYLRSATDRYMTELIQRERRQVIGEMAESFVHDFKNPLTGIQLAAKVILQAHPGHALTEKSCKIIEDQSSRMVGMAQEFLEYSRGKANLKREEVPLDDLFEALKTLNEEYLTRAGIEFTVKSADTTLFVDPNRFQRILQNLISNSVDALGPKGGVITILARKAGAMVEISVKDNGPGIPEIIRHKLFEPFVTHGKVTGTGLGMAIVKSLVEAHGGQISFASEAGLGTTFHIRLPARAKEVPGKAAVKEAGR